MAFNLLKNPITACKDLVRNVIILLFQAALNLVLEESGAELGSIWKAVSAIPAPIREQYMKNSNLLNRAKKKEVPPPLKQQQKAATTTHWLLSLVLSPVSAFTALVSLVVYVVLNPVSAFTNLVRHFALKLIFDEVERNSSSTSSLSSIHPFLSQLINRINSFEEKALSGKELDEYIKSMTQVIKALEGAVNLNASEFQEHMISLIQQVNEALDEAVPLQHPKKIHEAMRYSVLAGGKRVRPLLCIAACHMVGGDKASAMPMACAVEIIHTCSLIVNDLPSMDTVKDDLKRGKPTNHQMFDEQVSILACSALFAFAFQHVAASKYPDDVPMDRVVRGLVELASAIGAEGLVGGHFLGLDRGEKDVTLEDLEYINMNKTSKLLEASVVSGAMIGGASEVDVGKLRKYARSVGLLFQVVEDILEVTRSTGVLGETAAKDLTSNKATFPKLMGLDEAKKYADKLADQAIQEIAQFDAEKAAPLYHLAYYINSRKS